MRLRDVIAHIETLAPPTLAESWDNVGLLLGDRDASMTRVVTCLTLTPDVADEAVASGAQLIVTHHPVLFKPVQRLTSDSVEGRMLLRLLAHSVAVYSPHTAWDNAPLGINQQLAERLHLSQITPLRPTRTAASVKLVTFVPRERLPTVQRALWGSGCGVIGNYRDCSFVVDGMGTFFGSDDAHPAVGDAGRLETVAEARLEVICPAASLDRAITALRAAHPYEEPAVDVYPLQPMTGQEGAGRCGQLPSPITLAELAAHVGRALPSSRVEFVGDANLQIERLGIACGSAAEFWQDARRAGCQALLTGESRFHGLLEVRAAGFAMILAGHYATERGGIERLAELLAARCSDLIVTASACERDPSCIS